jgi:hypothetical protein
VATIGFYSLLETLQARRPEIRQEVLQRLEALRIDRIHAPLTVSADGNQPGFFQDLKVLRDRLLGDLEMAADLAGRAWPIAHELEDVTSTWLDQCAEDCLRRHPRLSVTRLNAKIKYRLTQVLACRIAGDL